MFSTVLASMLAVEGVGLAGIAGVGLVIAFVIYYVGSQAEEKSVVRASLRQLDGYEVENVRDKELLNPLKDRAITRSSRG
jgi:hypothetical protein